MLTCNVDIDDRLINGQIGDVMYVKMTSNQVTKIYLKFDDVRACLKVMAKDEIARNNS